MNEIENKIEQLTFNQLIMTASEFNDELVRLIKLVEETQVEKCVDFYNEQKSNKVMKRLKFAPRVSKQLKGGTNE